MRRRFEKVPDSLRMNRLSDNFLVKTIFILKFSIELPNHL